MSTVIVHHCASYICCQRLGVLVYPTGLIEWKDSPAEKKKADARMLSVNTNVKDLKNKKDLTEDERATVCVCLLQRDAVSYPDCFRCQSSQC